MGQMDGAGCKFSWKSVQTPQKKFLRLLFFAECRTLWLHPYRLMRHLRSISYGFVGILYSRRLILLYSNHLEGRQTVENHLVHMGTWCKHVMTSLISILVQFFTVIYFYGSRSVRENRENFPLAKISCYTVQILLFFLWLQWLPRYLGCCCHSNKTWFC